MIFWKFSGIDDNQQMNVISVAILGAAGRMGRALIQAAAQNPDVRLGAALVRAGAEAIGQDSGQLAGLPANGIVVGESRPDALSRCAVLIDFTRPDATLAALEHCRHSGTAMVIGTTGFTAAQRGRIDAAAREIPICIAANFSVGVTVSLRLLELSARALGPGYDIEIVEAHHRHKVDAPSGTALAMGRAVAAAMGTTLEQAAVYAREGHTGPRPAGAIGFATVRGGDVVGDHNVLFLGEGERLEIRHVASSRSNFAQGAVRAAAWLHGCAPGLYDMRDVLGLNDELSPGT